MFVNFLKYMCIDLREREEGIMREREGGRNGHPRYQRNINRLPLECTPTGTKT